MAKSAGFEGRWTTVNLAPSMPHYLSDLVLTNHSVPLNLAFLIIKTGILYSLKIK